MVVFSSMISITIGVIYVICKPPHNVVEITFGIMVTSDPTVILATFFASRAIIAFTLIFTIGQVLYFTFRSFLNGSKRELFYLRLTVVLSIVSSIIGGLIAAIDLSYFANDHGVYGPISIGEHRSIYGVWRTIKMVQITPNMTTIFVAAISCASVWIIYLSILWIYRGLDSDDTE